MKANPGCCQEEDESSLCALNTAHKNAREAPPEICAKLLRRGVDVWDAPEFSGAFLCVHITNVTASLASAVPRIREQMRHHDVSAGSCHPLYITRHQTMQNM